MSYKLEEEISGKNINFLIGSGASVPFYDTLSLGNDYPTLEDLLSTNQIEDNGKKILYYFYYKNWICPMCNLLNQTKELSDDKKSVNANYKRFILKIIKFLENEDNNRPKKVNIFTTNYDLLFEKTFEEILSDKINCYFNDGSVGFINRTLNPQNFNLSISRTGYNDKYKNEVPTINLIKMHGSVNWEKKDEITISVCYKLKNQWNEIQELGKPENSLDSLVKLIKKEENSENYDYSVLNTKLLELYDSNKDKINEFYIKYQNLSIINPNKWKFHETVFEQHYYQQLRNFSYELEKKQTALIIFGFSFADEHIEEIFKRSISNPSLEVYIICYSDKVKEKMMKKFKNISNIKFLPDFSENKNGRIILGNFDFLNSLFGDEKNE